MRRARRMAAVFTWVTACAPTPATLEVPSDGTLLLAATDARGETVSTLRRVEAPTVFGREPASAYFLGAYAAGPDRLGLVTVSEGSDRALPWPDAWFTLEDDGAGWIERTELAPPAWAREAGLARAALLPCDRWRARAATLPMAATVAAAARWTDTEVLVAWVDSATIALVGTEGPRGRLYVPRTRFTRTRLAPAGEGAAYYLAQSALYAIGGADGALSAQLVRNDAQSLRAGDGRVLVLADGQGGASLRGLPDSEASAIPIADLDHRVPVDAWPVPGGAVIAFDGVPALQRVGVDARVEPVIAAPGGQRVADVVAVTASGVEAWALATTTSSDTLVLSDGGGRWAWRAQLALAAGVRAVEPDGDGILVASASGLSAYAPAAGECAIDVALRSADVVVRVSDTRWFIAGVAAGGGPAAAWLEAR